MSRKNRVSRALGNTDWFEGGKDFAERVRLFAVTRCHKADVVAKANADIEAANAALASYDKLVGSTLEATIPVLKEEAIKQIEKAEKTKAECASMIELDDADKVLFREFYDADPMVCGKIALSKWAEAHGLTSLGMGDMGTLEGILGGVHFQRANSLGKLVTGKKFNKSGRARMDFFKALYGYLADQMVIAGAIKLEFESETETWYGLKYEKNVSKANK